MTAIDHANLSRLDLNLLVAFDALLTERSVTRAAARVGLGQSAMSHNLARLRTLFGDELLTRGAEGMRPTPRALALADPVRVTLAQIQAAVLQREDFDPSTAERVFRIGLAELDRGGGGANASRAAQDDGPRSLFAAPPDQPHLRA